MSELARLREQLEARLVFVQSNDPKWGERVHRPRYYSKYAWVLRALARRPMTRRELLMEGGLSSRHHNAMSTALNTYRVQGCIEVLRWVPHEPTGNLRKDMNVPQNGGRKRAVWALTEKGRERL